MKHLSVLIKPASSHCNMRCKYCFYHDLSENRNDSSYGFMTEETVDNIIQRALAAAESRIHFAFQGGEPTLMGLEFFENFVQKLKALSPKQKTEFSIQTNGLNMTEDFALFLRENGFLVGLSLDGTKEIHNLLRFDAKGNGTYHKILKTAKLFDRLNVQYNILIVYTSYVAKHIERVYQNLKKNGFRFLQFIPCLDEFGKEPFGQPYSLTPKLYADSLKQLFKLYYSDYFNGNYISIRYFDNLVSIARGIPPEHCSLMGYCTGQMVVEGDGTVFPCDFYCTDAWKLGNINDMSVQQLIQSETMQNFMNRSMLKSSKCQNCEVFGLCRGGCRRYWDDSSVDNPQYIYCEATKDFLTFAAPYLNHFK